MDGRTDRQTDRQSDSYIPLKNVFAEGINSLGQTSMDLRDNKRTCCNDKLHFTTYETFN